MADKYGLNIKKGDTFILDITYKDSDGNAIDLTGARVRMHIRETISSTTTLLVFDTDLINGSATIVDAVAGTIQIKATAVETAALAVSLAVYDLEIIDSGGEVTTILEGDVAIKDEVTRD